MAFLTQNKKIALSAIIVFIVSFSTMVFFLHQGSENFEHGKANVLNSNHASSEATEEGNTNPEAENPALLYKDFVEDLNTPFLVVNIDGNIEYATNNFCKLIDADCEKFIKTSVFNYINAKDLPDFVSSHTKIIQEGKAVEVIGPFRFIKNKEEILLLFNATPVLEDKKVVKIIFSAKDLTGKIEEMNGNDEKDGEKQNSDKNDSSWIEKIYPKIKEIEKKDVIKLVVDKVT